MAQIHDERDEVVNEDEEIMSIDTLGAEAEPEQEPEPTPVEEDDTPEKYKGKTAVDLIRMHQEAEKQMGRQSQEVGTLRKEFDTYVQAQLVTNTATTEQSQTITLSYEGFEPVVVAKDKSEQAGVVTINLAPLSYAIYKAKK